MRGGKGKGELSNCRNEKQQSLMPLCKPMCCVLALNIINLFLQLDFLDCISLSANAASYLLLKGLHHIWKYSNIKCMLVRTFRFIVGGWNGARVSPMRVIPLCPWTRSHECTQAVAHIHKQIPQGVAYNTGRTNGVLLSAPVHKCGCVSVCFCVLACVSITVHSINTCDLL